MSDRESGGKRKRQKVSKVETERGLEELLFGSSRPDVSSVAPSDDAELAGAPELAITIDRGPAAAEQRAWVDEDDEEILVDVSQVDRLKKLKYSRSRGARGGGDSDDDTRGDVLTGGELSGALRERYQMREVQWAATSTEASSDTTDILQQTESMVATSGGGGALPKGRVQLQRVMDANAADPGLDNITACQFSSSGELLVVGGADRWLRVFRLNEEEKSEKVLATRFHEMPILGARLRGYDSAEVIVTGRKPYFYSYDLESGIVTKVRSLVGSGKSINSHETMAICPDGSKLAFAGAGGYIHVLSGQQKTWMMDLKMNTAVRAVTFASDTVMMTAGLDADVYTWDIRNTSRCVSRTRNEDGTCVSSILSVPSASNGDFFTAVGSESGVVTLYNTACDHTEGPAVAGVQRTSVLSGVTQNAYRDVMNLTTKITAMAAHPSGQMLAISSDQKRDQLRLVHTASGTVFENWPTENTPLRRVQCMDFSPLGNYLAIGNNRGRVLLYKLNHFDTSSSN